MKTTIKIIVVLCSLSAFCSSCESWLQVRMKDKILEGELFRDIEGYMTALNGVYVELNGTDTYGRNLSMGALDVMAQYYDVKTPKDHAYKIYGDYDYTQTSYKNMRSGVWTKMYALIANVNLLLENCNRSDCPLPQPYSGLITGEAYALRGMLHFDLLRLWGPGYTEAGKNGVCIPYMESSDRKVQPLLTAEAVINKVIGDLTRAEELLTDTDPVIKDGPKNGSEVTDANNYLNYRQYRLNYYAVKALLARAYMWKGDMVNAARYASDVIGVSEGEEAYFPFVNRDDVLKDKDQNPDRIFSTEVLFGLYNTSRTQVYNSLFSESLSPSSRLSLSGTFSNGRIRTIYPDENDIRFALWAKTTTDSTEVIYLSKYAENKDPKNQYMIPLIRTSEMFLIKAECSPSLQEAQEWINKLRFARGCLDVTLTTDNRNQLLQEEFTREMIGEGQLFFFYKRKGLTTLPDGSKDVGTLDMSESSYVWPLPEKEQENRMTPNR